MVSLPVSLPPPPLLGSLRSAQDQRGAREPLCLSFDWGVPAQTAAGREAVRAAVAEMWAFARKDPRKPVFAAKVTMALAFTTLLAFLHEPRDIARHSIWAILTVVVVFEFSIGTLLLCFLAFEFSIRRNLDKASI